VTEFRATAPAGGDLTYGRRTALLYEPFMAFLTLGRYRSFVSREARRLRPGAAERVIDICCGTGLLTRELALRLGPEREVVGVDSSAVMLDVAGRRVRSREGGTATVSFVLADASRLPLADQSFHLATMFLGLHEIDPPDRVPALREVRRVLRPGGRGLILDISSSIPRPLRWAVRAALIAIEGRDAWTITDPGIAALLRQAGLEPKERRAVFGGILELVGFTRPLRDGPLPSETPDLT